MARPRVRYDESGQALPCKVFVPAHLARFLYREAMKARKGEGGLQVEETDIVLKLIETWAQAQPPVDWPKVLDELKAEETAAADAGVKPAKGSGKKLERKKTDAE